MLKRLFLAIKINPGEEVIANYYRLRLHLKSDIIKWVEPDNFHLTLKFFGETDEDEIGHISNILSPLVKRSTPFNIKLSKTGIFGSAYAPRVIWFGMEEETTLINLGNEILDVLDKNGYPRGRQNFVPHLTIGRIKKIVNRQKFQPSIDACAQFDGGNIKVTELTLFESILKPRGPLYIPLQKYEFGK